MNREKKSDAHGARARQLRRMRWQRRFRPLARWLNRHQPPEAVLLFSTALVVGLGVGFAEIFFHYLIDGVHQLSFEQGSGVLHFLGRYYVILIPALGGLLVGPMVYFVAPEAKGHGVPEVMEAVALRGGRIRPIVAVIKSVASAITIGSGGAAGREGPIVQIGSALGSTVGQVGQMSHDRTRMLVACGAAGGIAATFNAPVAGVLFALEIILGEFTAGHFSTVVVSSVTASVISRIFLGDAPAFTVPEYALESFRELPFYVILGLLAAPVGVAFSRVLYRVEDVFDAWKVPGYVKPALGGLGVGVVGLMVPQAFGVGYGAIESALHNQVLWGTAAIWLLAKLMATSLTLGSGGSGGVFAPGLFMGAMLGSTFGTGVHAWFPAFTAVPGAYALVGMSAVFASAANAPITAVLILFEMTGDYRIILPLMLATVISTLLARRIDPESIYTTKLSRRGIRLQQGRDIDVMQGVCVEEVMSRETSPVPAGMPVSELSQHFWRSRRHACPVLKEDGRLLGIVSVHDLEKALSSEDADKRKVGQIATRSLITIHPDEPVWEALNRMGPRDLSSLPVVDREDHGRLLGVIRRRDIVRAYNVAIMRREEIQQKVDQMQLRKVRGAQFVELEVEPGSSAADTPLSQLRLPRECIIVSIRRDTGVLIPHGETVLRPGDRITAFVEQSDEPSLRTAFAAATA